MKTRKMKLYISLFAAALMTVFFTACAQNKPAETAPAAATPEPAAEVVAFSLATPTPSPVPSPTPSPTPRVAARYTFAWMTDPQYYTRKNNGVFEKMTAYLKENREKLNLQYIVFTGDFVHEREDEAQWQTADKAMQAIDDIPNGVLAGNHDVGTDPAEYDYARFCSYFGESRYAGRPWYGASFRDNRGHYDLISVGKTDYIFVYLGFQVEEDGIRFAKEAFDAHPDRVGILCVHDYFDTDLTLLDTGKRLLEAVVTPCRNVYLVLCGHRYASACIPVTFDDDGDGVAERSVCQMIANYQAIGDKKSGPLTGGDGYMRFFDIDEAAGTIGYYSYSPYLDDYTYFDEPKHLREKYAFSPDSEQGSFPIPWTGLYK